MSGPYKGISAVDRRATLAALETRALIGLGAVVLLGLAVARSAGRALQSPDRPYRQASNAAEQAARASQYDRAEQEYEKLLKAHPQSAELWSNLGAMRALGGKCAQALPALERARSLNDRLFSPWYFLGYCHLAAHQNGQALRELEQAVRLKPRDPNAWMLEAQAAANLDRLGASFRAGVEALALDPGRAESFYFAGKTALDLAAECYQRVLAAPQPNAYALLLEGERNAAQGVWELAVQNFQKAKALGSPDAATSFSLATVYLERGNYPEAEAEFRRCLKFDPRSSWAKLRLALALAEGGKRLEAREIVSAVRPESLRLEDEITDYVVSAYVAGLPELGQQGFEQAEARLPGRQELETLRTRLALLTAPVGDAGGPPSERHDPSGVALAARFFLAADTDAGNIVAGIFPSSQRYRWFREAFLRPDLVAAAKAVSSVVDPLPREPQRAFALGEVLHLLSYRLYQHLATAFPDSPAAMRLAAENFSTMGKQDKALEVYQALLDHDGPSPEVLRGIAQIYWTEHRWAEALKVLQALAELDPKDPTIFVNLGRIYSYEQDWQRAEENFLLAAALEPRMFEAHLGLGETLRRMGHDERALEELKAASAADPTNPRPHYELAQIYRKLGKADLAARELSDFRVLQAKAAAGPARQGRQLVPLD